MGEQPATDIAAAPQTAAPEVAPTPQPEGQDTLAPKFAALAKKEKWIRQMQTEINKQKQDLQKKEEEYKTSYVPKNRIKENFIEVALENGLTPDQIANALLAQSGQSHQANPYAQDFQELRNEIKALKGELHSTKTGFEESKKTDRAQAVNTIRNEAQQLIDSRPEFEALKAKGLVDKVVKYIEDTYDEDGIVLKTEDACREFEEALIEDALNLYKLKKVQDKIQALTPKPELQSKEPQKQGPKTLTNGMSPPSQTRRSERDRVQRAILRAQGIDPDAQGASI